MKKIREMKRRQAEEERLLDEKFAREELGTIVAYDTADEGIGRFELFEDGAIIIELLGDGTIYTILPVR